METEARDNNESKENKEDIQELIRRDVPISDIVDQYGLDAAEIMLKYGLHCVGCHVSAFETLEQGSLGHGMLPDDFESMMNELNEMAKIHPSNTEKKSSENSTENKESNDSKENEEALEPKKEDCCNDTVGGSCGSEIDQTPDVVIPHNDTDPVFVTEKAAKKALSLMDGEDKALLVQVIPGGCSGFSYDLGFCRSDLEGDVSFEIHGLKVVIGKGSLSHIKGSEIDFIDTLNTSGFKINNPSAQSKCGCGKSFN